MNRLINVPNAKRQCIISENLASEMDKGYLLLDGVGHLTKFDYQAGWVECIWLKTGVWIDFYSDLLAVFSCMHVF